ncbi:hypothetical protein [Candidatus Enterovibrio altilux]
MCIKIIAAELNASNVTDGKVLSNLFKPTCRRINKISYDGAQDSR